MNNLSSKKLFLIFFLLSMVIGSCNGQLFHKSPEKALFGKTSGRNKGPKVKEPRSVLRGKRKQEANNRRLQRNYDKAVKRSQKRSIDIQTPEVQARMKQDKKDNIIRDREKKKNIATGTKGAEKKYKK
jgi:hypothetical protein